MITIYQSTICPKMSNLFIIIYLLNLLNLKFIYCHAYIIDYFLKEEFFSRKSVAERKYTTDKAYTLSTRIIIIEVPANINCCRKIAPRRTTHEAGNTYMIL